MEVFSSDNLNVYDDYCMKILEKWSTDLSISVHIYKH